MPDNQPAVAILNEALQAAASKAVEEQAPAVLGHLIRAALVGPASAALGAIAGELIKALFDRTEAMDRKLSALMREPFETAKRTVIEALAVRIETADAQQERERVLTRAADLLERAYTLEQGSSQELVRYYQCLVAALRPQAQGYLELYTNELRQKAGGLRTFAAAENQRAEEYSPQIDDALRSLKYVPRVGVDSFDQKTGQAMQVGILGAAQSGHQQRAKTATEQADSLDLFCDFVLRLARQMRPPVDRNPT